MPRRTSMTREEQEQWAVEYLAANLSREEVEDAESSITVQAFADFFAAQSRTFNKMHFAARVRQQAAQSVRQRRADKFIYRDGDVVITPAKKY